MEAYGGRVGIVEIGAVYLGAAVIAAASPTPGGLGAIEAALVAGLTGIGLPPGPAVSAVLTYRLATYWLPVVPGWAALRSCRGEATSSAQRAHSPSASPRDRLIALDRKARSCPGGHADVT